VAVKFVLDTNVFSALNRGDVRVKKFFSAEHEIVVPLIVVGELKAGFAYGSRRQENDRLLRRLLDSRAVTMAGISEETASIYADVYLRLREIGRPIGANDMWIAAVAIEQALPLLTLDRDFEAIQGLELVKL
jgi:tRNA(fMet)-specific endonuclease VapC